MLDTGYGGAMETGDGWDDTGFMATEPGGQMVASETAQGQWEWDGAEWVWAEGSASYPADANAYGSPEYGDWASHEDDDGNQYWYNAVTGETQWEPPPSTTAVDGAVLQYAAAADGAAAAAAYGAHDDGAYDETQWDYDPAAGAYDEGGGLPTTAAAGAGDDGADGDPWLEMRDDDGNLYYYNHVSGEAAWERPAAAGAAGVPPLPLEAAGQEQQQPAAAADGVSELAPPLDAEALEAQALMASATKRQKRKSHVKPSQASAAAAAAADRAPPPLGQVDLKLAGKASKVDMGERQWDVTDHYVTHALNGYVEVCKDVGVKDRDMKKFKALLAEPEAKTAAETPLEPVKLTALLDDKAMRNRNKFEFNVRQIAVDAAREINHAVEHAAAEIFKPELGASAWAPWHQMHTRRNEPYWYNVDTKATTWTEPPRVWETKLTALKSLTPRKAASVDPAAPQGWSWRESDVEQRRRKRSERVKRQAEKDEVKRRLENPTDAEQVSDVLGEIVGAVTRSAKLVGAHEAHRGRRAVRAAWHPCTLGYGLGELPPGGQAGGGRMVSDAAHTDAVVTVDGTLLSKRLPPALPPPAAKPLKGLAKLLAHVRPPAEPTPALAESASAPALVAGAAPASSPAAKSPSKVGFSSLFSPLSPPRAPPQRPPAAKTAAATAWLEITLGCVPPVPAVRTVVRGAEKVDSAARRRFEGALLADVRRAVEVATAPKDVRKGALPKLPDRPKVDVLLEEVRITASATQWVKVPTADGWVDVELDKQPVAELKKPKKRRRKAAGDGGAAAAAAAAAGDSDDDFAVSDSDSDDGWGGTLVAAPAEVPAPQEGDPKTAPPGAVDKLFGGTAETVALKTFEAHRTAAGDAKAAIDERLADRAAEKHSKQYAEGECVVRFVLFVKGDPGLAAGGDGGAAAAAAAAAGVAAMAAVRTSALRRGVVGCTASAAASGAAGAVRQMGTWEQYWAHVVSPVFFHLSTKPIVSKKQARTNREIAALKASVRDELEAPTGVQSPAGVGAGAAPDGAAPDAARKRGGRKKPALSLDEQLAAEERALAKATKRGYKRGYDGIEHPTPEQHHQAVLVERLKFKISMRDKAEERQSEKAGPLPPWRKVAPPPANITQAQSKAWERKGDNERVRKRRAKLAKATVAKLRREAAGELRERRLKLTAWLLTKLLASAPYGADIREAYDASERERAEAAHAVMYDKTLSEAELRAHDAQRTNDKARERILDAQARALFADLQQVCGGAKAEAHTTASGERAGAGAVGGGHPLDFFANQLPEALPKKTVWTLLTRNRALRDVAKKTKGVEPVLAAPEWVQAFLAQPVSKPKFITASEFAAWVLVAAELDERYSPVKKAVLRAKEEEKAKKRGYRAGGAKRRGVVVSGAQRRRDQAAAKAGQAAAAGERMTVAQLREAAHNADDAWAKFHVPVIVRPTDPVSGRPAAAAYDCVGRSRYWDFSRKKRVAAERAHREAWPEAAEKRLVDLEPELRKAAQLKLMDRKSRDLTAAQKSAVGKAVAALVDEVVARDARRQEFRAAVATVVVACVGAVAAAAAEDAENEAAAAERDDEAVAMEDAVAAGGLAPGAASKSAAAAVALRAAAAAVRARPSADTRALYRGAASKIARHVGAPEERPEAVAVPAAVARGEAAAAPAAAAVARGEAAAAPAAAAAVAAAPAAALAAFGAPKKNPALAAFGAPKPALAPKPDNAEAVAAHRADLEAARLTLTVVDAAQEGSPAFGSAVVPGGLLERPVGDGDDAAQHEVALPLRAHAGDSNKTVGTVTVRVDATEADARTGLPRAWRAVVVKAEGLPKRTAMTLLVTSAPVCRAVFNGAAVGETPKRKKTLKPSWVGDPAAAFAFALPPPPEPEPEPAAAAPSLLAMMGGGGGGTGSKLKGMLRGAMRGVKMAVALSADAEEKLSGLVEEALSTRRVWLETAEMERRMLWREEERQKRVEEAWRRRSERPLRAEQEAGRGAWDALLAHAHQPHANLRRLRWERTLDVGAPTERGPGGERPLTVQCVDPANDRRLVVRTITCLYPEDTERLLEELAAYSELRHHGLARVHDAFGHCVRGFTLTGMVADEWTAVVATQAFQPGGRLVDRLDRAGGLAALDEERLCAWMASLAAGLRTLHQAGLTHRNLRPEAVYLDARGRAVLAGYQCLRTSRGPGCQYSSGRADCGDSAVVAPEVEDNLCLPGPEADMWALGCCLYRFATGRPIGDMRARLRHGHQRLLGDVPQRFGMRVRAALKMTLQGDPRSRADADAVWTVLSATDRD